MMSRRDMVIGLGLITGGGAVFAARRESSQGEVFDYNAVIPEQFGEWTASASEDAVLAPQSNYARSVYEQIITRRYSAPGRPMVTVVIAANRAQSYASQVHRPEICYPASNFEILDQRDLSLDLGGQAIPAGLIEAQRGSRVDEVLYWTRIGDAFPRSLWEQRRRIASSVFTSGLRDGVVVRFSVTNTPDADALVVMDKFAQDFYIALPEEGRSLLLGSAVNETAAK